MPKQKVDGRLVSKGKQAEYHASNKGRKGRWDTAQKNLIDQSVSIWHNFACIVHKDLEGGHSTLAQWKKDEASRLLSLNQFAKLPADVSIYSITE